VYYSEPSAIAEEAKQKKRLEEEVLNKTCSEPSAIAEEAKQNKRLEQKTNAII